GHYGAGKGNKEIMGDKQTSNEYWEKEGTAGNNRRQCRGMADIESPPPARIQFFLAAPAHFIKRQGRNRPDQGEAGHQRKQKRQRICVRAPIGDEQPRQRIYETKKNVMRRLRPEVVESHTQGIEYIRHLDAFDVRVKV